jgi:hypothetical protein
MYETTCLFVAQGCRLLQRSKFGSYLGYTDRDGSLLGAAAPDPKETQFQVHHLRRRKGGQLLLPSFVDC